MEDKLIDLLDKAESAIIAIAPDVWNALLWGERIEGIKELMLVFVVFIGGYIYLTRLFSFFVPLIKTQNRYWDADACVWNGVFIFTGVVLTVLTPIVLFELPDTFMSLAYPEVQVTRELIYKAIG